MTIDDLTNASIAALQAGSADPVACYLVRTERRDAIQALSRNVERARFGRVVNTVYRLNGDRIPQYAADLLIKAYGGSRTPVS